jgi:hypothetical protein
VSARDYNPRIICRFIPPPKGHGNHDPHAPERRLVHTGTRYELQSESESEWTGWELIEGERAFGLLAGLLDPLDSPGVTLDRAEVPDGE